MLIIENNTSLNDIYKLLKNINTSNIVTLILNLYLTQIKRF